MTRREQIILFVFIVLGIVLPILAARASVADRHVALEFSDYRVKMLRSDFKTAKACQSFIAQQRKQVDHQPRYHGGTLYGCDSGSEMVAYLQRVFGKKAVEVLQ